MKAKFSLLYSLKQIKLYNYINMNLYICLCVCIYLHQSEDILLDLLLCCIDFHFMYRNLIFMN